MTDDALSPPHKQQADSVAGPRKSARRTVGKDTSAARWRRMVRLASEALALLEAGHLDSVRNLLAAMEAVARRAAEEELAGSQ